ncbi:MAG: hypothetical protein ACK50Y_01275 [Flavobacteriia bacterium]|jgi:hypothetical protein
MKTHTLHRNPLTKFVKNIEFNRYGLISIVIILIGCFGGIAIGKGAIENTFALAAVILPTMGTLSLLLAVAPMKQILIGSAICMIIDITLILYYTIAG